LELSELRFWLHTVSFNSLQRLDKFLLLHSSLLQFCLIKLEEEREPDGLRVGLRVGLLRTLLVGLGVGFGLRVGVGASLSLLGFGLGVGFGAGLLSSLDDGDFLSFLSSLDESARTSVFSISDK
jgi:hypothetical protein